MKHTGDRFRLSKTSPETPPTAAGKEAPTWVKQLTARGQPAARLTSLRSGTAPTNTTAAAAA